MIELFFWPTPNGRKITIMLEEAGLGYTVRPVAIGQGEQFAQSFTQISPNQRIPAIIDHMPTGGEAPRPIFESGAILMYLAQKTGQFIPNDEAGRWSVIQWLMWQVANVGPMLGQYGYFLRYSSETVPHAIERYRKETRRLYDVLERQLASSRDCIAGAYSIADIALFPWIMTHKAQQINLDDYPNIAEWYGRLRKRPKLQAGLQVGKEWLTPNLSQESKRILFEDKPAGSAATETPA